VRISEDQLKSLFFAIFAGFCSNSLFTVVVPLDTATQQVTPPVALPVTLPVNKLMKLLNEAGAMGNAALRERLGLKDRLHLREHYVAPAMAAGLIEMTLPEKPNSHLQRYRLTGKGRAMLTRFVFSSRWPLRTPKVPTHHNL
jgi:hypothetical protein